MKFHFTIEPSRPLERSLTNRNTGWVSLPFTSIFVDSGKVTPWLMVQNSSISESLPGSWWANWSHGNPSTTRPSGPNSSCRCCRPSYCGVKPHLLAVFTMSTGLPA
ncbi:unannotated protein [freshwater metagenome]|uniref:Unannotated protein n=1 Tax=freshwater metagenome TaxID=449393 RepID=A0A6J7QG83_9ZZZZ